MYRWVEHVAQREVENAYKFLLGKPEMKMLL